MQLRAEQLENQLLNSPDQQLAPVYIISGDEPFQSGHILDVIRDCARAQSYADRKVFFADRGFDWQELTAEQNALSLFSERRVLELRLPSGKPGDTGARALVEYAAQLPEDTVLILSTGKLEKAQTTSKWYKALDKVGVAVQVWPVSVEHLPAWIRSRMQAKRLQASTEAVQLLAERMEGNLLAAEQAMEKILLANGPGEVDADAVAASVSDSARFDLFTMVDSALSGKAERALRMVYGLLEEGVEPVVINWALTKGIRETLQIALAVQASGSMDSALARYRVWEKRKPVLRAAVKRRPAGFWGGLLQRASRLDRLIKGRLSGNAHDELVQLVSGMAGSRPLPVAS